MALCSLNKDKTENENASCESVVVAASSTVDVKKAKLWHLRLGHLSVHILSHTQMFQGQQCTLDSICQICPQARQSRNVFPLSSIQTKQCFQLVLLDIWGPYHIPTHNACKFFITLVDDFSKMAWVSLLHNKSDACYFFLYKFYCLCEKSV